MKNTQCYLSCSSFFFMILLSFFISPSAASTNARHDSYAIFSMGSSFEPLSKSRARMIYTGKIKKINNTKVVLSDWPDSSPEKETFYKVLLGKTVSQMNGYWASLAFSGKAKPPKSIKAEDVTVLVEWLKENPTGIGYAPLSSLPSGAHVLFIISKGN
ncbi:MULTISPECIES: hypothetical protein [Aliivibrio]|uniref:hypothetical protein n=1 Tax=Aliivibrio TaxID=511678 RepID=UPI0003C7AFFB|nr:hypothetical protein [Aliivibrio logei]MBB1311937.1 hypothetical protein [Aliivibrio sp. SR45-2]